MTTRAHKAGALATAALYLLAGTATAAPGPAATKAAPASQPAPAEPTSPASPPAETPDAPPSDVPTPPPTGAATRSSDPGLSEADTLVVRAGLDIDTAEAGPSGPVIVSRMEELGNLELRRAEILPSRLGNDPVIRIRVSLQPGASDVFLIRSDVTVRGEAVEGSAHDISCSLCTEGEVVERARGEIVRLIPYVRARFRPAEKPPEKPPVSTEAPKSDVQPLGTKGKAGIGLLAGGVVVLATGIGLAVSKPRADPDNPLNVIDTKPAGYGLLAVGGAALVTGAILLALDRRAPPARRTVQLAPFGGHGTTGLLLFGRF
jgi:hypothetical protein